MQLTPEAQRILADLARRHGISPEAVQAVFRSLAAHDGTMAQFNHPDLGGMGQWLRGGMTMVGGMVNGRLKQHVDALCSDLADALQRMGPGAAGAGAGQPQGGQGGWGAGASEDAADRPNPGAAASPARAGNVPGQASAPGSPAASAPADPLALIERLAELRQKGVLTDEEFTAKKTELLSRL